MTQTLNIIWYDVKNWKAHRESFQLERVSAEDYIPEKHTRSIITSPSNFFKIDIKTLPKEAIPVHCWIHCSPESDEEKQILISMGKWQSVDLNLIEKTINPK